ncbi:hypothetical protein C8F01DRAFT_1247367 [Mycena amicta]|nr:hypothetical protein C8F01DRAFT_1247367 [Mycena amicta]
MATTARQPKPPRKGAPEPARRQQAWTGARASPTFSPSTTPQPPAPVPPSNGSAPQDRVLQSLAGLTGTTITLSTKTSARYEGVIASTSNEGDTTGVTLRDVKDLATPAGPLKDSLFIAATNINDWTSGPADAKLPNEPTPTSVRRRADPEERELQAWQPSSDLAANANANAGGLGGDDETFGAGSTSKGNWDQFNANEKLFGVKTSFDEDAYTTKLDRNAPDFKERERKALRIANEIQMAGTSNPHVAEERNQNIVDDSGVNEEDKYGAVVRSANAYVPPGARKPDAPVPKVSVNGPDGISVASQTPSKSPSPVPSGSATKASIEPDPVPDPVTAFSDFVTNEKQRLQQKRQALVKNDMDKRMADLVKFSESFKLNKPIPDDLVSILSKDADKQRQIKEKSNKDASAPHARNIGASSSSTTAPGAPRGAAPAKVAPSKGAPAAVKASPPAAKPAGPSAAAPSPRLAPTGKPAIPMLIQSIPPFKGAKTRQSSQPAVANGTTSSPRPPTMTTSATTSALSTGPPPSPNTAAANRLNVNATSFKPTTKATSVSPKPKNEAPAAPNPFFGTRPIKKNTAAHIKDDFNPFKHNNKVVEAAQVSAMWPYNGKRYMLMFPQQPQQQQQQQQPHPQQQQPPHMPPPNAAPIPVPPPPPYAEEDSAAAAARGYVYYPYYPSQMMPPGMVPQGPPYMQYMQPMPYPPGMPPPPNAMYASPSMGQMQPPPQVYMQQPPPGAYPPNGAAPRPSMPPTPIPAHPHPYYQQSPQLGHAVAYPMMMQQPPTGPVHPYEGAGQMGQHS